jgi:copper chaperone
MSTRTTYTVSGMTCGHCVAAVTREVSRIDGVQDVAVDLTGGTVSVVSDTTPATDRVRAAVDEAGYELTGVLA